jgi:N-acylneuraminate cytidylyltransferase
MDAAWLMARESFVSEKIGVVQMSAAQSQDIDTLADFERCEAALTLNQKGSHQ